MKSGNKFLQWLTLVLCVVMCAGVLTQAAGAAEATGKCTNVYNEGIEYFQPMGELAKDANRWRAELNARAILAKDGVTSAGTILAMEVEIVNNSNRYQCTEITKGTTSTFSCNSVPNNALISGLYLLYKPNEFAKIDEEVIFKVTDAATDEVNLLTTRAKVKMPPYPCAREILTRDMKPATGKALVFYTQGDCETPSNAIDAQSITFYEKKPEFAIVNIIEGDALKGSDGDTYPYNSNNNRVRIEVDPDAEFDYDLDLVFEYIKDPATKEKDEKTITYHYEYDPATNLVTETIDAASINGLTIQNLPLTLKRGSIYNIVPKVDNAWGTDLTVPASSGTSFDFHIKFWYENIEGTLGYQNSVFHFERDVFVAFSNTCESTATASAFYDTCQTNRQMFSAKLETPIDLGGTAGTTYGTFKITNNSNAGQTLYWFLTRKCENSDCTWMTQTPAYVHSISVSKGGGAVTYPNGGVIHTVPATRTGIRMIPYATTDQPYRITGVNLVVEEPGTYLVVPFAPESQWTKWVVDPAFMPDVYPSFYVTVPKTNEHYTCSTLANNGYFRANWNDCLDPRLTQLITFEHVQGKEEAWMENRSNTEIYFPYVPEWSYVPQKLQIASLTYKAEALSDAGRPGRAWCTPEGCMVPPYTRVTITGGTFYLESSPKYDEYRVAYARQETYNISHLFFSIHVKECEKKIPDTGISLRSPLRINERIDAPVPVTSITRNSFQSPLKVNAKVNDATSYVFTGNSLRIPAIGLGMETPLPIVHVYYEDGSDGMKWDLSTLGNYVGELEGGSYIPYGGNSVLTGHYWSGGVFKNLEHLNLEDEIYVYGNDGVKYIYKVVQKFIAQPEDVYEMFQPVGDTSLTLVTCENYNLVTDEYERRYIVRAVLESQDLYEEGVW